MPRVQIDLTSSYQQISSGKAVFTIKKTGGGLIFFNDVASDTAAMKRSPDPEEQFTQTGNVATFAKGDGYTIIVDDD